MKENKLELPPSLAHEQRPPREPFSIRQFLRKSGHRSHHSHNDSPTFFPPMRTSERRSHREFLIFLGILLSVAAIALLVICING